MLPLGRATSRRTAVASNTTWNRMRSTDARTRVASKDPMITPAAAPGTIADAADSSTLCSPAYVSAAITEIGSTAAIVVPLAVARAIPIRREVSTGTMTTPPATPSSPHSPPATAPATPRTTVRSPGRQRLIRATIPESNGDIFRLRPAGRHRPPDWGLRQAWTIQLAVSLQRSPVLPRTDHRRGVIATLGGRPRGPGVLPGSGGWAVAMEDLGAVGVPGGGRAVRVQDELPAPAVDDHLMMVETEQDAVFDAGGAAVGLVPDVVDLAAGGGLGAPAGPPAVLVPQGDGVPDGGRDGVGVADVQRQAGPVQPAGAELLAAQEGRQAARAGQQVHGLADDGPFERLAGDGPRRGGRGGRLAVRVVLVRVLRVRFARVRVARVRVVPTG